MNVLADRIIAPEGSLTAKIMLVGEAPGRDEDRIGKPFVGNAGYMLDTALGAAGIRRSSCYITNLINRKIDDNNFDLISPKELARHTERLKMEISKSRANVIVLLGAHALKAITGEFEIQDYRGSILEVTIAGRIRKVIPTVHPAWMLRNYHPGMTYLKQDLIRAKEQSESPDINRTLRDAQIPRSAAEVAEAVLELDNNGPWLACDIESKRGELYIYCVGFACSRSKSYTFFFTPGVFTDGELGRDASIKAVKYLLKGPQKLIFQNGCNFNVLMLREKGFEVNNYAFDTFCAAHQMIVELPRSLKFLNSIYTDMPFYKDMLKEATSAGKMNYSLMGEYNGIDCMTTFEVAERQMSLLGKEGMDFHKKFYMDLVDPLIQTALEGVRIDVTQKDKLSVEMQKKSDALQDEIVDMLPEGFMSPVGERKLEDIRAKIKMYEETGNAMKKNGLPRQAYTNWKIKEREFKTEFNPSSSEQCIAVLYTEEGFDTKKVWDTDYGGKTRRRKLTADDEALQKILGRKTTTKVVVEFVHKLVEYRRLRKLITSYLNAEIDKDGRIRCVYNIAVAKTGRLSSSKSIFGTGINLQTIPKKRDTEGTIRKLFLPDEGDVFVSGDLSQAEARVVAALAGEKSLIERFEAGQGVFEYVASVVFKVDESEVTKDQRNVAKTLVHGTNYGMQEEKFARTAGIELEEAERIWRRYCVRFPRLELWRESIRKIMERSNDKVLVTPYGRTRVLLDRGARKSKNSDGTWHVSYNQRYLRDAYAYVPQSTIGDGLNLGGIIKAGHMIKSRTWHVHPPKLRMQIHDQVVYSAAKEDAPQMKDLLEEALPLRLEIKGRVITIPAEVEVGDSLGDV